MLNVFTSALRSSCSLTPSTHRLRRGLPGYLILFATHAFAPQRQLQTREPPSPLVFLHISSLSPASPKSNPINLRYLANSLCLLFLKKKKHERRRCITSS